MPRLPNQTIKSADGQYEIRTIHRGLPINARLEITLWRINEQKKWIRTGKKTTVSLKETMRIEKIAKRLEQADTSDESYERRAADLQKQDAQNAKWFEKQFATALQSVVPPGSFDDLLEKLGR